MVNAVERRKLYSGFKKPRKFDTNLIVIGAGSGGLVSAYIGATLKARVTLIERDKMGGDCLKHWLRAEQGTYPCGKVHG